jgi:hypothetical protein
MSEHRFRPKSQFRECGMLAGTMKPVFRIAVIRLPTVHDAVHPASVWRLNSLSDAVRRLQMVVPKQNDALEQARSFF